MGKLLYDGLFLSSIYAGYIYLGTHTEQILKTELITTGSVWVGIAYSEEGGFSSGVYQGAESGSPGMMTQGPHTMRSQ